MKKKEYVLSKQLLRCGTSIGANINEAQAGQSKADFIAKMSISSKEARESKYWIDLLIKTDYLDINESHVQSILKDIEEIIKLLTSIIKTSQGNM
jgi:four helix bundle protein